MVDEACVSKHTAMIHDRGGVHRQYQLIDLAQVEWARKRNGKTSGVITLSGRSCRRQADVLSAIEARRFELVLFRGQERVWEGPIKEIAWYSDSAVITAFDVKDYLDGTMLSRDWPGPDGGGTSVMTTRIEQILDWELHQPYTMRVGTGGAAHDVVVPRWEGITPPANVWPFVDIRAGTVTTRSDTVAFQMTVGEHLQNLSESGVDYTTVGRSLIVWDAAVPLGRTRTLTESDFYGDLEVYEAGSEFSAISHISPQERKENEEGVIPPPIVGSAGAPDDYYGVWTRLVTSESESGSDDPTQDALNSQAQRGQLGRNPVPLELRVPQGASLRLSHDLGINDLVPGVEMPVLARLNLKQVSQLQVLTGVKVTEDGEGETIKVDLTSAGEIEVV